MIIYRTISDFTISYHSTMAQVQLDKVNYGRKDITTDFAFVLNNYESKKSVIIGTIRMSKENANLFSYKTSIYDDNLKDYINHEEKIVSAINQEDLINKVALELKSQI